MSTPGDDQQRAAASHDKAGTWQDWPVKVIVVAILLGVLVTASGGRPSVLVWLLLAFGVISLLIRRGAFTPRS